MKQTNTPAATILSKSPGLPGGPVLAGAPSVVPMAPETTRPQSEFLVALTQSALLVERSFVSALRALSDDFRATMHSRPPPGVD